MAVCVDISACSWIPMECMVYGLRQYLNGRTSTVDSKGYPVKFARVSWKMLPGENHAPDLALGRTAATLLNAMLA